MNSMQQYVESTDLSSSAKRKSYGSIEKGLAVNKYRNKRLKHHLINNSYIVASKRAARDVIAMYGEPMCY